MAEPRQSARDRLQILAGLARNLAAHSAPAALEPFREDIDEALDGLRAVENHVLDPDPVRSPS